MAGSELQSVLALIPIGQTQTVIGSNRTWIDPVALRVELHRAEIEIEGHAESFIRDPHREKQILSFLKIGQRRDGVACRRDSRSQPALFSKLLDLVIEHDLVDGGEHRQPALLEVELIQFDRANRVAQAARQVVLEGIEIPPCLLVLDE